MATEYGFIYILANECMPGIYKIGFTQNHPKARLDQLSASTSCPVAFDLVAAFGVANPRNVEQRIHAEFWGQRVNSSREFFRLKAIEALGICRRYGDEWGDLYQTNDLEAMVESEEEAYDQRWKLDYFHSQCADPVDWPDGDFLKYDDIPF